MTFSVALTIIFLKRLFALQAADRLGKPLLPIWHSGPFAPENLTVKMGALQYQRVSDENFENRACELIEQLRKLHHEINFGAAGEEGAIEEQRASRYTT